MTNTNLNEEYLIYKENLEYVRDLLANLLDLMDIEIGSKQDYYKNNREARFEIEKNLELFEIAFDELEKIRLKFDEINFEHYLLSLPKELRTEPKVDYKNIVKFPTASQIEAKIDEFWVDENFDISHIFKNNDNDK